MNCFVTPNPTLYGFLFFPLHYSKITSLSFIADDLFKDLCRRSHVQFIIFQHIGPEFCNHTEFYTAAALELVKQGILINTNISNN